MRLSYKQLEQVSMILKVFVNTSDVFRNGKGEIIDDGKEVEIYPNTGLTASIQDIREIRAAVKEDMNALRKVRYDACGSCTGIVG